MMKLDLHLHTCYSPDSLNRPGEIIAKSRKLGITPAITDHESTVAHAVFRQRGFDFIPGFEVKTDAGDLIGLYAEEAPEKNAGFAEAVDSIKEQGGLCYLPHMYDRGRSGISDAGLAGKADVIEVWNGACDEACNMKADEFAGAHRKAKGAGSDAHLIYEYGRAWVGVRDFDIREPKELLRALGEGMIMHSGSLHVPGLHKAVKLAKGYFRI